MKHLITRTAEERGGFPDVHHIAVSLLGVAQGFWGK
jgi:hypothetical protein